MFVYETLSVHRWYDSMFDCMFIERLFLDEKMNVHHTVLTAEDRLDFTLDLLVDRRLMVAGYLDEPLLPF